MIGETTPEAAADPQVPAPRTSVPATGSDAPPGKEIGGREGLEPTRYGDWEKNGRCIDF